MKKSELYDSLQFFIEPHEEFIGSDENIFTPNKDIVIVFWFEGGFQVSGGPGVLHINFNAQNYLVLALKEPIDRIIRIPWKRLIAFELQPQNENQKLKDLLKVDQIRKN